MRAFLFILLLYPFIEVAALVGLASRIGSGGVMLYILGCALLGIWMLRHQKLAALLTLRTIVHKEGRIPMYSMLWPMRYVLAGLLLILPGIINTLAAVLLLLPLRRVGIPMSQPQSPPPGQPPAIDGEYQRVDDLTEPPRHLH